MKIDLHLHSKFSTRPQNWVLRKLGCPESYTEPSDLPRLTSARQMDALTITDHNSIEGCLAIAHRPDTFISEEVTTYFPEDGCKVHVLVWDIDRRIHDEIQKVRENVFDLVAYLQQKDIAHACAHPLFSINNKLSVDRFEQILLLFQVLELNGTRDEAQNQMLRLIVDGLQPGDLAFLSEKHGFRPPAERPWAKTLVGGSDDHSGLNIARCHTEVVRAETIDDFFDGLRAGRCLARGRGSSPRTLAHNLYGIAFQYFNRRFHLDRFTGRNILIRFLDRLMRAESRSHSLFLVKLKNVAAQRRRDRPGTRERIQNVLWREAENLITSDPVLMDLVRGQDQTGLNRDEQCYRFVTRVSNNVFSASSRRLVGRLTGANVFSLFDSVGAAGSLGVVLAPYFVSFGLFGRDRRFIRQVERRFLNGSNRVLWPEGRVKVAHFTDTFLQVNGVARTLRQQAALAAATGRDLTMITCDEVQPRAAGRVRHYQPVAVFDLPAYEEVKLCLPPLLEILSHVYESGYTYLHAATPGPMGLTALAVARILDLPLAGTYHTSFPQYTALLTGDQTLSELMWHFVVWFYDQMDRVYVPSRDTGRELVAKGIHQDKIRLYPRGVDLDRFHPDHGREFREKRPDLDRAFKLLYVGRVSREKNLPQLVTLFRELCRLETGVHLVVVGEGPYLADMKAELADLPATFAGYLRGRPLAETYAGADLFVFPSTTDTFGNVVLEAQASGVPVIVTDCGGPRENVLHGRTGLIVPADDVGAMLRAVRALLHDRSRLRAMAAAAREHIARRSFETAFAEQWRMYAQDQASIQAGPSPAGGRDAGLAQMVGSRLEDLAQVG